MKLEDIPEDNSKDIYGNIYVIREMSLPHCAKGPKGCEKCREAAKDVKIYLLKVYPDPGTMTRPIIEVNVKGETSWMVYDVKESFKDKNKARDYAKKNNLTLVEE